MLLLDEPAAGLDSEESTWLGDRIRSIGTAGTGLLLVDHDVNLVLGVCDSRVRARLREGDSRGPPEAIRADRTVAAAYLGTMHDAEAVTA